MTSVVVMNTLFTKNTRNFLCLMNIGNKSYSHEMVYFNLNNNLNTFN